MRVHELAKQLNIPSKELIDRLTKAGFSVKNHMSVLPEEVASRLTGDGKKEEKKAPAPPKKPARAPKPKTPPKSKISSAPAAEKPKPQAATPPPEPVEELIDQVDEEEIKPGREGAPTEHPLPLQAETKPKVTRPPVSVKMPATVGEVAASLKISVAQLIKALIGLGIFANVNQVIDEQVIKRTAGVLEIPVTKLETAEVEEAASSEVDRPEDLLPRCPVVTIMGHVDHGKTSLLDYIRKSNVASRESGGITQHIGAYEVRRGDDKFITFLDTPGHAAFSAMRARGANVTDVVILVVAANDGVMPQTIEALDHARAAEVPIVVAINKVDLPDSSTDKIRKQLQKYDLMPEDWGGKTIMVPVSAKTGKGVDQLLESLLLEAEVLELKANPKRRAEGVVVEGRLTQGQGPTATVIVQNGTLRVGDPVICGSFYGKVRALRNNMNAQMKEAMPAQAVEILGLNGVPEAADQFRVMATIAEARQIAEARTQVLHEERLGMGRQKHLTLDDLHTRIAEGKMKDFNMIIKADTQGSLEALTQSIEQLSNREVHVHVIHGGTGAINDSDIMLAAASDAVIIGFHVRANAQAEAVVEKEGIDLRYYDIIYDAVGDIKKALEGLLEPTLKEITTGRIEIRKLFTSSKVGTIGGGYVTKGLVGRTHQIRVLRGGEAIFTGKISALKRFKDDVKEVKEGFECGISIVNFDDLKERDIIESFRVEKVASRML